jgi:hypothetical protein
MNISMYVKPILPGHWVYIKNRNDSTNNLAKVKNMSTHVAHFRHRGAAKRSAAFEKDFLLLKGLKESLVLYS